MAASDKSRPMSAGNGKALAGHIKNAMRGVCPRFVHAEQQRDSSTSVYHKFESVFTSEEVYSGSTKSGINASGSIDSHGAPTLYFGVDNTNLDRIAVAFGIR